MRGSQSRVGCRGVGMVDPCGTGSVFWKWMVVVVLIALFLGEEVNGIYTSKLYTIAKAAEYNVVDLESSGYGFLNGGSMKVNFTTKASSDSANLVFAVIPFNLWLVLNSAKWSSTLEYAQYMCDVPSIMRVPITTSNADVINYSELGGLVSSSDVTYSIARELVVNQSVHYSLLLLKCDPTGPSETIQVRVDLELINPNGQHLSTQKHPYILLFIVLVAVYGGLLMYWLFYSIKNKRHIYRFHVVVAVALFLQIVSYGAIFTYYEYMNIQGSMSDVFDITLSVIGVFGDTSFLLILLLVSLGYSIVGEGLNARVKVLFFGCFGMYFGFRILYAICMDSSICSIFLLSFKVIKFIITFGIIIAMNQTIDVLRIQSAEQQFGNDSQSDVFIKMKKYKAFRLAFIVYLIGPLISLVVQYSVITWVNFWVLTLVEEALVFYMNYFIVKHFYPQPFSVARAHQD